MSEWKAACMNVLAPARPKSGLMGQVHWLQVIDRAILAAETAELELSRQGGYDPSQQRKTSGSFYTPSDVAGHFWDLFFRHHRICDLEALTAFISASDLIEPSAGSGIFVFSFLRKAALLGATPEILAGTRFHVVDVNLAALRFFSERMREIEDATGADFRGIEAFPKDFLDWATTSTVTGAVFVGNPPFVANPRGARWRNLYADFMESILAYPSLKAVSLILPLSVCFSRDYVALRRMIMSKGMGVSASNYDNMPDCLFKVGKPDSINTNRANSQRCTIINVGGPKPGLREATALQSWTAAQRPSLLSSIPDFRRFSANDQSGQIPRPASDFLASYLRNSKSSRPLRTFLSKGSRPSFAVGGVARNFIGIRDYVPGIPGAIPIKPTSTENRWIILQILSSSLFFDYWRTYGDGFHVTVDLIERFPVTEQLSGQFRSTLDRAREVWCNRGTYSKEKLNAGRVVRSYDFRKVFEEVLG